MYSLFRIWIWPVWLAFALAVSIPLFRRELDYTHPPAKLAGLIALAVAMGVWISLRRKWPRAELWVLAGALILPALIREPRATVIVTLMSAAALAFGRCACDWLKLSLRGRVEEIVISAALGFATWIFALMALGLAHLFYSWAIAALIVIALLAARRGFYRLWGTARLMIRGFEEPDALTGMALFAILVMIGSVHLVMLAPSLYYDAYAAHLAIAKYFALHHTSMPMPFLTYSWFPQGFELMMGATEIFAGQEAAQMIAPVFLTLNLLALYAVARELGASRAVAVAGSSLATAIPFLQWTGASAKNDLVLSFLLLVTLLILLRAWATKAPGWLYAAGIVAAAALDVKLSAMIYLPCLGVLYVMAASRMPRVLRTVAISGAIFLAAGSYVPVRSKVVHGSFVYPLHSSELNMTRGVPDPLLLPWRAQVHGGFAFNSQNETPCGLIFLLFFPAFLWMRRTDLRPPIVACVFFVGSYLLIGIFTFSDLRYMAAPIGLLVLVLTLGLTRTLRVSPIYGRIALLAAMAYSIDYNWAVMATLGVSMPRLQLLSGRITPDTFLRQTLPAYSSMAWIRDHARPGDVTLSIGNAALAYAGDPSLIRPFWELETGPVPAEQIRAEIASRCCRYAVLSKKAPVDTIFAGTAPVLEAEDEKFWVFRIDY